MDARSFAGCECDTSRATGSPRPNAPSPPDSVASHRRRHLNIGPPGALVAGPMQLVMVFPA
jgi:hypothetical protein